jgi:hypothetical protein
MERASQSQQPQNISDVYLETEALVDIFEIPKSVREN